MFGFFINLPYQLRISNLLTTRIEYSYYLMA